MSEQQRYSHDALDLPLFSDHMHRVHLPHRSKRTISRYPATVVSEQRAWYDAQTPADYVRYTLSRLACCERANVEGVRVERTDAFTRITFHIERDATPKGTPVRYDLDAAVARILAIVSARAAAAAEGGE